MPTLQPNFAKEPFRPSHAIRLAERQCSKNKRKITREMNNETLTPCIVHLADSANFKGVTSNKLCSGLTGLCFESPNDTIHVTVDTN